MLKSPSLVAKYQRLNNPNLSFIYSFYNTLKNLILNPILIKIDLKISKDIKENKKSHDLRLRSNFLLRKKKKRILQH
ncbi:unnamed protein product [Meloidogyne enterolobii]|uniref:Uncharacterized protein n=1 Tax=Meloidogyne enterolobii TaxID=390850 RepID=A0ACB1A5H4_MELEN